MDWIIETDNLTKQYGTKTALNNVSMHVAKGDIYGFIGKNGAGKTTAMKLLLGTSYPTAGKIRLFGGDDLNGARAKIGSLIESPALYKNCTAYENMKRASIYSGGTDDDIREILEFVGLGDTGKKKAKAFSLGMKQRLGIAMAMLGNPQLLILDEPVNGLDPAGIKGVRDLILRLNKEKGVTILVSSHLLDELAKIVTKYGIINNGELIEETLASDLETRCRHCLKIVVDRPEDAAGKLRERLPEANIEIGKGKINIYSPVNSAGINAFLVSSGFAVSEISYSSDSLEEYFIDRLGK